MERDLPCLEVVIGIAPTVGDAFEISDASDDMDRLLPWSPRSGIVCGWSPVREFASVLGENRKGPIPGDWELDLIGEAGS